MLADDGPGSVGLQLLTSLPFVTAFSIFASAVHLGAGMELVLE